MATLQLDQAMQADPVAAKALASYREVHLQCVSACRSPDDSEYAGRFAKLARTLGYTSTQVREDHTEFVRLQRAMGQFDPQKLKRLEDELAPLEKADTLFSITGCTACHRGFSESGDYVCVRERTLGSLGRELRAATTSGDRDRIKARMEEVRAKGAELAAARRDVEDQVIVQLNARDRLRNIRSKNRRLFPATDNGGTE